MQVISEKIEAWLPNKKVDLFGKDQLMHYTWPYYLTAGILLGGVWAPFGSGYFFILIIYTILPMFDEFFSFDLRNPTAAERNQLIEKDFHYKLCLYVTVAVDWLLFFKVMNLFSTVTLNSFTTFQLAGTIFIFSNLNSAQFAVAHEIFHKPGKFHKYLGTIHMIKNLYMHFTYEHLYGHHRRVATPEDPASAEKGINVYKFFWRSFFGSYQSVYAMQKYEQKKPIHLNYAVLSVVCSLFFTFLIFGYYGVQAGILFVISALGSIFYLQAINYIEHYGLRRKKQANGQYEKVTIRHSWNAPHRFSNYLLFKLQRHSDHHENSLKPYQTLLSLNQSPQLPHGYSVCIFMSFFPETWFKVMDPLVDEYNSTEISNVQGELMQKAVRETRIFVIKMSIATCLLYIASLQVGA